MLYRDDDINVYTDLHLLREVHSLFEQYNRIHTVAIEMENIWLAKDIWYWLMTAHNLDVGLHGWTHRDYGKMTEDDIDHDITSSIVYWNTNIKRGNYAPKPLRVFYPPWNSTSNALERVCGRNGLTVDTRVGKDVYNFHWWAMYEPKRIQELEKRLKNPVMS